ncbi:hypothetical protein SK128_006915, partial [Halocaridina rubra]
MSCTVARRLQAAAVLNGVQPPQHSQAGSQNSGNQNPPSQQPQQISHQLPPLAPSGNSAAVLRARQLRLQHLQVEHERLRHRQAENNKMEHSLRMSLREEAGQQQLQQQTAQTAQQSIPTSQQQAQGSDLMLNNAGLTLSPAPQSVTPVTTSVTTAADPFIATTQDFHSRQESADSGLGLGTNYSLPHTPEDFLASMEDVEITPSD